MFRASNEVVPAMLEILDGPHVDIRTGSHPRRAAFLCQFLWIVHFYVTLRNMITITVSKNALQDDELVAIPRRELEALVARAEGAVNEKDILRWSREARILKLAGKLPRLRSFRGL